MNKDKAIASGRTGLELIAAERKRQIEVEGFYSDDSDYLSGELENAAIAYRLNDPDLWPWSMIWWKPTPNDPIRQLVKSGALYQAEADRLNNIITHLHSRRTEGLYHDYERCISMVNAIGNQIDQSL